MSQDLNQTKQDIINSINSADNLEKLEEIRISALGKKGVLTEAMKQLGQLDGDARREMGQALNQIKGEITSILDEKTNTLKDAQLNEQLASETVDVSLSPRGRRVGTLHPIPQTVEEIVAIFGEMGFAVAEGPDLEDDWHNFQALNIPPSHPARQMQDTFYATGKDEKGDPAVLRTHTSPVQIRTMKSQKENLEAGNPIRIIAPGRTFRCDSDMTHTPMFHQVEGLVIDESVNFSHLKGVLQNFVESYFEVDDVPLQFRPSFFPFTEPSAEVDIGCSRKDGTLKIGAGDDWLEILGCGMVHPNVLENCGIDSNKYQGFAFGMGIERIAMLKYGIPDLRTFFDGDARWLEHYGFTSFDIPSLVRGL
ncbi:MAG: phenylalanine--tRNA ligase subunit alpha [Alphaproteobacteria bacterium]